MPLNEALITSRMRQYESFSTAQLLDILRARDGQRYAPEDFEAIRRLLKAREVSNRPGPQNGVAALLVGGAILLALVVLVLAVLFLRSVSLSPPVPTATALPSPLPPTAAAPMPSPTSVWSQLNTPPEGRVLDWTLRVTDNFNENQNQWPVGEAETDALQQSWRLENGVYLWQVQARQPAVRWLIKPALDPYEDFYVAVQLKKMRGAAAANAGLVFRMQDEQNYYAFLVNDTGGDFQILLLEDGQQQVLSDWLPSTAIRYGGPNKLAVLAEGTMLKFYLNERLVAQLVNEALPSGQVGLLVNLSARSDQALFRLDDLELRAP